MVGTIQQQEKNMRIDREMRRSLGIKGIAVVLCFITVCGVANAELIVIKPTAATASSIVNSTMPASNAINGTGINGVAAGFSDLSTGTLLTAEGIPVTADPQKTTWNTTSSINQNTMWVSDAETFSGNTWIAFDLGDIYTVSSMHVWNYNNSGAPISYQRGIKNVTIQYSEDNVTWTTAESMTFAKANAGTDYVGSDYVLTTSITTQYIRFLISSNFYADMVTNPYVGLQEVRFIGTTVPEPMTLGILVVGSAAFMIRRRK